MKTMKTADLINKLKNRDMSGFVKYIMFRLNCPNAEKMHRQVKRHYAFFCWDTVGGVEVPAVHLAESFNELGDNNKYGILAHEIGHYMAAKRPASAYNLDPEIAADQCAEFFLNVRIYYDKNKVQWAKIEEQHETTTQKKHG